MLRLSKMRIPRRNFGRVQSPDLLILGTVKEGVLIVNGHARQTRVIALRFLEFTYVVQKV